MSNTVAVVTISESFPHHGNEVTLRCFSSNAKATKWIESQIDEKVLSLHLDRNAAIDGWFVKLEGEDHTVQYNVQELVVR